MVSWPTPPLIRNVRIPTHPEYALIGLFIPLLVYFWRQRSRSTVSTIITRIFVHPIKSCRGTSVPAWEYTPEGLKHDRTFVIVDKNTHKTITAREIPKNRRDSQGTDTRNSFSKRNYYWRCKDILGTSRRGCQELDKVSEHNNCFSYSDESRLDDIQIWSHTTDGYICESLEQGGLDPSGALSKYLERDVLLIRKGPTTRHLKPTAAFPALQGSAVFQDGYPILVASEESLVDVQTKLSLSAAGVEGWKINGVAGEWTGELVMERFRPNVVVEGAGKPYAEEEWEEISFTTTERSGRASSEYGRMLLVSRCTRCQLPNIEPSTGIQHKHVPYKVLAKYRRVDPARPYTPCFGVNAVPQESGVYRVGDTVHVRRFAAAGKLPEKEVIVKN
ncbi:hypothetical protein PIIN_05263 [Serendipita indica DSM 11827]|uniref:MOSC domain-containing protein n=1 Tax=Serendipita indica (strain DSM 11827) TaxID=1109443 RepID=G4TJ22_SERID|nr:hypothetical protein PIIN_05263 [Serendipita indica DSM 11827]